MTITRQAVHEALLAALRGIHPDLTVYPGTIPEKVPVYPAGFIKPYVGVWVSHPADLEEQRSLSALADMDTINVRVQTQIVAASETAVYDVADRVRAVLTNLRVGTGNVVPDSYQQSAALVMTDVSVTPSRPYLPLVWVLNTQ